MGTICSKCQGVVIQAATGDPCAGARSGTRLDSPDPAIYDLMRRSVACSTTEQQKPNENDNKCSSTEPTVCGGQHQLLYKHQRKEKQGNNNSITGGADSQLTVASQQEAAPANMRAGAGTPAADDDDDDSDNSSSNDNDNGDGENGGGEMKKKKLLKRTHLPPTRLLVRRHTVRHYEEGLSGTHIYAIRYPTDQPLLLPGQQGKEQHDNKHGHPSQEQARHQPSLQKLQQQNQQQQQQNQKKRWIRDKPYTIPSFKDGENIDHLFRPATMAAKPKQQVLDWVTVSQEHDIYIADVGLTPAQCDQIVCVTEQVCRGQYAAYTYAKQTLGCREFPTLASVCQPAIHTMTHAILEFSQNNNNQNKNNNNNKFLALDDREPHMVKYDVTKKERQKLDMHTDKSEWTFLIALSNGSGMDYEGGGTYFECLDATVHIQRGHALVFPGKLRHCGQRITSGLRFLLVAFLVDKTSSTSSSSASANANSNNNSLTASGSVDKSAAGSGSSSPNNAASSAKGAIVAAAANSKKGGEEDEDKDSMAQLSEA